MTEQVTLTMEQLNAIIAAATATSGTSRRRGKSHSAPRAKPSPEVTEARRKANDEECIKVFTAAGYKDVRPRVNVLTYGKQKPDGTVTGWLGKGRVVKKGEQGLAVGPFNLFHEEQTEPLAGAVTAKPAPKPVDPKVADAKAVATMPAPAPTTTTPSLTDWNS